MSAYLSNEVFLLQQTQLAHQIYTPRSAGIDFYGDNLFTSERLLRERPEEAAAFLAASLRVALCRRASRCGDCVGTQNLSRPLYARIFGF